MFLVIEEKKMSGSGKMSTFHDIINGDTPVLVDFSAGWCAPCRMMPPILREVKDHFGEAIRILKIDVDKNPQLAQRYGIRSVPTLMVFRRGEVLFSQPGVIPASRLVEIVRPFV